jgi:hypothetical protein
MAKILLEKLLIQNFETGSGDFTQGCGHFIRRIVSVKEA